MGAYYKPTNTEDLQSFQSWDWDNGAKLMEHSYIGNTLVNAVFNEIENGLWKNKPISWICDYDDDFIAKDENEKSILNEKGEETTYYELAKNIAKTDDLEKIVDNYSTENIFILNLDKKEFVDFKLVNELWMSDDWVTNPFPLLTSSVKESMGGGDYHPSHPMRGVWSNDRFIIVRDAKLIPTTFKDISFFVLFYEDKDYPQNSSSKVVKYLKNRDEKRTRKSVFKNLLKTNKVTRKKEQKYNSYSNNSDIYSLLRENEVSIIKFRKKDGSIIERKATLDKDYVSTNKSNKNTSTSSNTDYIWFLDIEDDFKLKKAIKDYNFSITSYEEITV